MTDQPSTLNMIQKGRGRGRGRGGLGKYLRARGRGRGLGRPAEFNQRLLLGGETVDEDEEEAEERTRKFSKRQLGSNADRYIEPEPELGSDGEPEHEPEVDLSSFFEKQRISDTGTKLLPTNDDIDHNDVDITLAHISTRVSISRAPKRGKMEQIEWDKELEELSREKASAEATRDLKSRFRAKSERLRGKLTIARDRKAGASYADAPALPLIDSLGPSPKDPKDEMQDFLDDLLS